MDGKTGAEVGMQVSQNSENRQRLSEVLERILEFCDPRRLTRDKLSFLASADRKDHTQTGGDENGPVTLIAVGKASLFMALGATDLLHGKEITGGMVVAPHRTLLTESGRRTAAELEGFGFEVLGAEHPFPGEGSFRAGRAVLEAVRNCMGRCLYLLSGGASSLMELNQDEFPRDDVARINRALVTCGADIAEINTVRKHFSAVKGGRLAREFPGTAMVNLIISDVMGSALDTIGSGPTSPDSEDSTFERCREILGRYDIFRVLSEEGRAFFLAGDDRCETPKELLTGGVMEHHILMSNELLVKRISREFDYTALSLAAGPGRGDGFTAVTLASRLLDVCRMSLSVRSNNPGTAGRHGKFVIGGEPTVRVEGKGTGGRAQHTALLFLAGLIEDDAMWERRKDFTLAAFATDGMDGNSPAAGAIVDRILFENFHSSLERGSTSERVKMLGAVKKYLDKFNSHAFFDKYGLLIGTGPTGTNVLDVYLLEIDSIWQ